MKTCEYAGEPFSEPRSHPWTGGALDASARYYDFTASPELIRTSLEDFQPFEHYAAVQDFYALLERVNHPRSPLVSSDCAFNGPAPSQSAKPQAPFECSGRLMVLYRALELNTFTARVSWLKTAFHQQLARLDTKFAAGVIGTTLVPARYLALPEHAQLGHELMLSFWAFGESEPGAMQNLARLFKNLSQALRGVSALSAHGA